MLEPNHLLPGESLGQFHARIYAQYSDAKKAPAVAMLREKLALQMPEIRDLIAERPDDWATPYHFFWGMGVRNMLRQEGFGEDYWPIWNLDDLYVCLVEDAAR